MKHYLVNRSPWTVTLKGYRVGDDSDLPNTAGGYYITSYEFIVRPHESTAIDSTIFSDLSSLLLVKVEIHVLTSQDSRICKRLQPYDFIKYGAIVFVRGDYDRLGLKYVPRGSRPLKDVLRDFLLEEDISAWVAVVAPAPVSQYSSDSAGGLSLDDEIDGTYELVQGGGSSPGTGHLRNHSRSKPKQD